MAVGYFLKILTINLTKKMALSIADIKTRLTERKKKQTINAAIYHQNRVKFHALTSLQNTQCQTLALNDFLGWVKQLLPNDKYAIFKQLFRFPVKTNELTGICFDKLSRIFDGRNPAFNYQFMNTEERDDWEYYRQDVLNEPEVWETMGWEHFKTEINSVLIVDMPTEPSGDKYPQPYFYFLTINNVIDYEVNAKSGNMDYIIFKQPNNTLAVIDELSYRVYKYKDAKIGEELVNNPHGLGYCPARFFWNEPIDLERPDVKKSALTKQLESLDWFLFFHLSKRHLDMYGAYPIYSGYAQNCDYVNEETGETCDGGFLRDKLGKYIYDSAGLLCKCPKCSDKRINGVGSFVEIPIPDENQVDLRNPVQMLTADVSSLKYNVDEETRLKENIIKAVVGEETEILNNQALNETQVQANYESQSQILQRVKRGFEEAQKFVDETICRLRYKDKFVSAKISYGTDFFMQSAEELRARYKTAKESGATEAELDALQNQIIESEYRNNPMQLQRMIILADLEPMRHFTHAEAIGLYDKQLISAEELQTKLHFSEYVRRFERENTNVLEFAVTLPYEKKIQIIKNTFRNYANENTGRTK